LEVRVYARRIATVLAGVAAGIALMGTAASAHECFIAGRSANGDANATNSDRWTVLTAADIATLAPPGTDQACVVDFWLANGGPESLTVRSNKIIGEDSSNPNLANVKGLDHAEDVFGGLLAAAVTACS
jgi:hypothetical protein